MTLMLMIGVVICVCQLVWARPHFMRSRAIKSVPGFAVCDVCIFAGHTILAFSGFACCVYICALAFLGAWWGAWREPLYFSLGDTRTTKQLWHAYRKTTPLKRLPQECTCTEWIKSAAINGHLGLLKGALRIIQRQDERALLFATEHHPTAPVLPADIVSTIIAMAGERDGTAAGPAKCVAYRINLSGRAAIEHGQVDVPVMNLQNTSTTKKSCCTLQYDPDSHCRVRLCCFATGWRTCSTATGRRA